MPIPTLILFIIALCAAVVMAVGWAEDPSAPTPWEWLVAKATEGGLWTGVLLSLLAVVFFGWRGRRADRKAKKPH